MTDHTPGPWRVIHQRTIREIHSSNGPKVADVYDFTGDSQFARADARLIAAAPELLEALKEIQEGRGAFSMDHLTHAANTIEEMKALAKTAIAKAEGEE